MNLLSKTGQKKRKTQNGMAFDDSTDKQILPGLVW